MWCFLYITKRVSWFIQYRLFIIIVGSPAWKLKQINHEQHSWYNNKNNLDSYEVQNINIQDTISFVISVIHIVIHYFTLFIFCSVVKPAAQSYFKEEKDDDNWSFKLKIAFKTKSFEPVSVIVTTVVLILNLGAVETRDSIFTFVVRYFSDPNLRRCILWHFIFI